MKKIKYLSIGILPFLWLLYFLFELFTGRINSPVLIMGNLFFIILFGLVGLLIYSKSTKYPNGFKSKHLYFIFLTLFVIDQGIKIIINNFYFNYNVDIIKGFISFNPIINTSGSWLNARFNTGISFSFLIIFNALALFIFFELYRFIKFNGFKGYWYDMCFIFIFCGALCSLIDKTFYGGSLDFIGISNLFIADIKDIYINLGILFFIMSIYISGYLTNESKTNTKEDIEILKKFLRFIKLDIKSVFKHKNVDR